MSRRDEDRDLVREALRRAGEGAEPPLDALLDAVPRIMLEAERRRAAEARRDVLAASIPVARVAIPRFAAAAVLLVAASVALLWSGTGTSGTGDAVQTVAARSVDTMLLEGNGITEEWLLQAILQPDAEDTP